MIPTRSIANDKVALSTLGLGGAPLGNLYAPLSDRQAGETLEAAWAAGIRFFDTAPFYGFGLSERRFGDALRSRQCDDFVLSTKAGRLLQPLPAHKVAPARHAYHSSMPFEPVYDYSYDGVMRSFEHSLQRLGLARIDILLLHDIGRLTHGADHNDKFTCAMEGGLRALDELRRAGAVSAIGLGVNECEVCEAALEHGDIDVFLLAGRYTLLEQGALDSLLPKCERRGTRLIIGGPYNSGILAQGTSGEATLYYNYASAPSDIITRVRRLENLCADHCVPLPAAALQFPLLHPFVACVLPGARNAAEVLQNAALFSTRIPQALWSDLKSAGLLHPDAPVGAKENQ
jgi:D-threo-aldose 1-dehydrogenase